MVRRAPNYCPQCGGSFRLKAKVPRISQKSEVRYLQCSDCRQIVVCNFKNQRAGLADQAALEAHNQLAHKTMEAGTL